MTALPDDQRVLLDGLMVRLGEVADQTTLIRFMGEVLRTLLRRQGDAEFLATIGDAFASGLAGLNWTEQKALAAEVIRVVIDKRPEIARAWQARHSPPVAPPVAPNRRDADRPASAMAPPPATVVAKPPPYAFAAAETRLAAYVVDVVFRRLDLLRVTTPEIPSIAYCHSQPFFLFAPGFRDVLRDFFAGPLLEHCRSGLERRVYCHADAAILDDTDAWAAFMVEKRDPMWKVLLSRLGKLAAAYKTAEAKQAAARLKGESRDEYKIVEIPETRRRVYSILGVGFTLGQTTVIKRMRVRVAPADQLEPAESEALDLLAALRGRAALAGLDLPPSADFQFLRTLLEFNARLFVQTRDELMGLAAHEETSTAFLAERFKAADEAFNPYLVDMLAMMVFTRFGDARFGMPEFYAFCVGAARDKSALGHKRPFAAPELTRRPRELAFQLREALRRRLHVDVVSAAVEKLMDCWQTMGRKRFGGELDAALTVIGAFPMVFAGDPEEASFTAIGQTVATTLTQETPDRAACLKRVGELYDRIGRKAVAVA